jgi:hypothetical protein
MGNTINVIELARAIAEIASQTRDPDTAVQLVEMVDRLLTKAGLPPASKGQSQDQLGRQ